MGDCWLHGIQEKVRDHVIMFLMCTLLLRNRKRTRGYTQTAVGITQAEYFVSRDACSGMLYQSTQKNGEA